jgi:hypothetical protein
MSAYVELFMDQGADFSTTIAINDENNNIPQNLTGSIVTSQMRKSLVSLNATASIVCTIPVPTNGEILLHLDAANTANITAGTYFFDARVKDINLNTSRLVEGIIFVTPSITR